MTALLKNMYFKMILLFSGVVCIHTQRSVELCHTFGCFKSSDTTLSLTVDGDDVYYADFKDGLLVWESRLPLSMHVPSAYQYAVRYRSECKHAYHNFELRHDQVAETKTKEAPEVMIYPRDQVLKEEENTLICFINHFFPPSIKIKWTKNDIEVTVENPFIKCLPNSDGTYHVLSNLRFVPKEGDIYGCTVEHQSLEEPQTRFWELDTDEISLGPAVFCGLGLSLGLLGVTMGTFFFVKGNQYPGPLLGASG